MRLARALLLVLLASSVADARPGGGQSYRSSSSSGSRSSGSSYRSSGSSSSSSYRSSGSSGTIHYSSGGGTSGDGSVALVVIAILFGLFFVMFALRKLFNKDEPARASVEEDADVSRKGIDALERVDPSFDEGKFAERVRDLVGRVNQSWVDGNMGKARRFISDGVYVRFQTQLALLRAQSIKNAMADWRVHSATVLEAEADALWDTVHVKLVAEARDIDVPATLSTAEAVAQAKKAPSRRYEEVWSFLRRRGKTSESAGRAFEGKCPSCGAELPASEVVRCEYCKALTNSGEHDWVLAEITQPEEWSPGGATGELEVLDTLRARDPMLSRQALEDRASVVFWKWIDARVTGDRKRFERFCRAEGVPAAPAAKLSMVAVGAAECEYVEASPDGYDRVHVDITWSGSTGGAEPENQTHRLTLARANTAKSLHGLSSLDCPSCGGALAESDSVKCQYCGTPLTGGQSEWSLEAIEQVA
jgi:hypothetical protein